MRTIGWVAALFLAAGAGMLIAARSGAARSGEDAKALVAADLAFGEATAAEGLEGWLSWFAPDAVIYPASRPAVKGLAAIRDYYKEAGFDPKGLKWKPTESRVSAAGDMGFTSGTWEMETVSDGKRRIARGKYLTVWQRQRDGRYRVLADIGSADAPAKDPGS